MSLDPKPVNHVPPTRWRLEQKAQLKRVHEALRLLQTEIAAAQAKLHEDDNRLKAKRTKLKEVWQAQQSIAAQTAEREAQVTADAQTLAELWKQAGRDIPLALGKIGHLPEKRP